MSPDDPRHGSDAGYTAERRLNIGTCPACREAHRRSTIMRRLYPHKTPAIGSRQRIAEEIGYTDQGAIAYLMRSASLRTVTAAKIAAVYDRLSMTVPTGAGATRARNWAARHGYPPPLAWDDDTIDDPAAEPAGQRTKRKAAA